MLGIESHTGVHRDCRSHHPVVLHEAANVAMSQGSFDGIRILPRENTAAWLCPQIDEVRNFAQPRLRAEALAPLDAGFQRMRTGGARQLRRETPSCLVRDPEPIR